MFGLFRRRKNADDEVSEKNVNKIVDYTIISPTATKKELERAMCVAYKNRYYSVVVNPINVEFARSYIDLKLKGMLKLVVVVGFPLGENCLDTKIYEIKKALAQGADEVDVAISVSRIKMGEYSYVKNEVSRIAKACRKAVVKIIIESSSLNRTELSKVVSICAKYKVNFVQTSTGFAGGGATIDDIELIKNTANKKCAVKASGGIENRNQAIIMLRAGATRIGTSREI